jgi:Domain of unknown function (DUF4262)
MFGSAPRFRQAATVRDVQIQAWNDQEDAYDTELVRRHGWKINYIFACEVIEPASDAGEGPPFAYTVGLFGLHHPELVILGVTPETAAGVLNTLGDRIRAGASLMPGTLVGFDEWPHRIIPEQVPNPGEIVFGANRFYDRPSWFSVPVLQLSHDDCNGRFPWEPDYAAHHMQPRPGTYRA